MNKNLTLTKNSQGFTLVEVVVALVIIATVIASASAMVRSMGTSSNESSYISSAASFAQDQVEALRNRDYDDLPSHQDFSAEDLPENLPLPRSATVVVGETRPGLKQVTVTVVYGETTQTYVTLVRDNASD